MYVYAYDTFIDSWFGWQTYAEFVEAHKDYGSIIQELNTLRSRSGVLAEKHLGWQGDYREQYVTSLPGQSRGCENRLVFAWKQGSKGSTFIASPYPMVWLAHLQHVIAHEPAVSSARSGVWIPECMDV
jgi:hypothetical protein